MQERFRQLNNNKKYLGQVKTLDRICSWWDVKKCAKQSMFEFIKKNKHAKWTIDLKGSKHRTERLTLLTYTYCKKMSWLYSLEKVYEFRQTPADVGDVWLVRNRSSLTGACLMVHHQNETFCVSSNSRFKNIFMTDRPVTQIATWKSVTQNKYSSAWVTR